MPTTIKPFTSKQVTRLVALEAKMDQKLFGQHYDAASGKMVEDDSILPSAGTVAGTAAVAGGAVGAYKLNSSLKDRMGGLNATRAAGAAPATYVDAAKSLGSDAWAKLRGVGGEAKTAVGAAATTALQKGRTMARGGLLRAARAIK